MHRRRTAAFCIGLASTATLFAGTASAIEVDTPTLRFVEPGKGRAEFLVTAGATGAPNGFTVLWATEADFLSDGELWTPESISQHLVHYYGSPTLNAFPGEPETFLLAPGESITIQLGDIADETGVIANDWRELGYGTDYVFTIFANGGGAWDPSAKGPTLYKATLAVGTDDECVFTQGYWKNHLENWPTNVIMLGNVLYNLAELNDILHQPVEGNGLVSLAHQLIATRLNIENGANAASVLDALAEADALIGDLVVPPIGTGFLEPAVTSALTEIFDEFNNGLSGPYDCDSSTPTLDRSWSRIKSLYR